ncbi:MAG: SCP2 sterol-binding domain-containing protein [Pseudomonadota bacterium]
MIVPPWLMSLGEGIFNRVIALDQQALARARAIHGKTVGVDVRGMDLQVIMAFCADGVRLKSADSMPADAWIRGAPLALLRAGAANRAVFNTGDVVIEGDLELGHAVQRWLHGLDIDWEEQLSRFTGDPIAHHIGASWRRWRSKARDNASTNVRDGVEYLRDEWQLLPFTHEAERFFDSVDSVRGDADRLAQRITELEARKQGPSR